MTGPPQMPPGQGVPGYPYQQPPPGGYQSPPGAYQQYPPPQPPKKSNTGLIIGLAIGIPLLLIAVCCVGFLVFGMGKGTSSAAGDVKLVGCDSSATGTSSLSLNAHLEVKNSTSSRKSYVIFVAFTSADGGQQLAAGEAGVTDLAPGQKANTTASALFVENAPRSFRCKVTDVTRL